MECRKHVEAEYQRQGIHMYPTFCPQKVEKDPDGHLTVIAKNSEGKEMALTGMDCVLMATGRSPNSKHIGLEEVCTLPCILCSQALAAAQTQKHVGLEEVCISPWIVCSWVLEPKPKAHRLCLWCEQVGVELEMGGSIKLDGCNQTMLPQHLVSPQNQVL